MPQPGGFGETDPIPQLQGHCRANRSRKSRRVVSPRSSEPLKEPPPCGRGRGRNRRGLRQPRGRSPVSEGQDVSSSGPEWETRESTDALGCWRVPGLRGGFHPGVKATARPPEKGAGEGQVAGVRARPSPHHGTRPGSKGKRGLAYPTGARPPGRKPSQTPRRPGRGAGRPGRRRPHRQW